jgi:hypothetical protein
MARVGAEGARWRGWRASISATRVAEVRVHLGHMVASDEAAVSSSAAVTRASCAHARVRWPALARKARVGGEGARWGERRASTRMHRRIRRQHHQQSRAGHPRSPARAPRTGWTICEASTRAARTGRDQRLRCPGVARAAGVVGSPAAQRRRRVARSVLDQRRLPRAVSHTSRVRAPGTNPSFAGRPELASIGGVGSLPSV